MIGGVGSLHNSEGGVPGVMTGGGIHGFDKLRGALWTIYFTRSCEICHF